MAVVDASVVVKFIVDEDGSSEAGDLLRSPEPLIAPDWVLVEVGHALWKKVKEALSREGAMLGLAAVPTFLQELHPATGLLERAYELAFRLQHWVYDCLYLQLALQQGTILVTADQEFRRSAARHGFAAQVRLLGMPHG